MIISLLGVSHMNYTNALQTSSDLLINISHSKRQGYYTMPSHHYHEHYEIYYLISGERNYFIKDKIYSIKKGDLVLIYKNDIHKTIDSKIPHHERLLIDFKEEFLNICPEEEKQYLLRCFETDRPIIRLDEADQVFVENLIKEMLREQSLKESGYFISLKTYLIQLLIFINRLIEQRDELSVDIDANNTIHERISEIVQYINRHYDKPLSLTKIADIFYISPYYLSRLFKEVTGFNFVEYLNLVRIREAQKLLKNSNAKIIEIAQAVGFKNVAHFGRVFKKITSLSPSSYRKHKAINHLSAPNSLRK